jgi:4-amino-4-deoxy-L-arabinose transferase-like glycosyltransferase
MLWLLPVTGFAFFFALFSQSNLVSSARTSFLWAALVWGTCVVGFTEILSAFRILTIWPLAILWVIVDLTCFGLLLARLRSRNITIYKSPRLDRFELWCCIGLLLIVSLIGVIALLAPPNTWDAMTYHLARIMHWIQNRGVGNYPTHIFRQLYLNPWAEYAILQFQLLSGGDRFANLIQWFSMVGSGIGISLIAKQLKANTKAQILSAVFALTTPMAIMQGSSTQNDFVATFWLVSFVYFGIRLMETWEPKHAIPAGLALGLALLTKATSYLFAIPFLFWITMAFMKSRSARSFFSILIMVLLVMTTNIAYYGRNVVLFGNPLSPPASITKYNVLNEIFLPQFIASNLLRNAAINIGVFPHLNHVIEDGINALHERLGISVNDPRTTWPGTEFHILPPIFSEDHAGNLVQTILIFCSFLLFVTIKQKPATHVYYLIMVISGYLLFSALLKWQPWNTRLELPLFILISPWIGLVLSNINRQWLVNTVFAFLFIGAIPWMIDNSTRPLLGDRNILTMKREAQYFAGRPELYKPYSDAAGFLKVIQCYRVGLISGPDDWEYPLWQILNPKNEVHIEHVNVTNVSSQIPNAGSFEPCAVIVLDGTPASLQVEGRRFIRKWQQDHVLIFLPVAD